MVHGNGNVYQWGEINSVDEKDIYRRIRETTTKFIEINWW